MRIFWTGVASIVLSLLLTAVAAARPVKVSDTKSQGNITGTAFNVFSTNRAGRSGVIGLSASHQANDGTLPPPSGTSVRIAYPRGSRVDRNVAETGCTPEMLDFEGACPDDTQLGTGHAKAYVGAGNITWATADISVYRVPPLQQGDIMGLALYSVEPKTGVRNNVFARIFYEGGRHVVVVPKYSLASVFGITPVITDADFKIDAYRWVRRRTGAKRHGKRLARTKRVKQYLLTNPRRCRKSWRVDWERRFEDGTVLTHAMDIPCKKGKRERGRRSKRR